MRLLDTRANRWSSQVIAGKKQARDIRKGRLKSAHPPEVAEIVLRDGAFVYHGVGKDRWLRDFENRAELAMHDCRELLGPQADGGGIGGAADDARCLNSNHCHGSNFAAGRSGDRR